MNIRLETPADYRAVEELTREAFWNVYRPGCTEHYVLHRYRSNPDFLSELSLVMTTGDGGRIIGHVMYSRARLVADDGSVLPSWTFGPISIHPDFQCRGYGLALLTHSLGMARELGIGVLCMEGKIDFYRHAGFGPASSLKIHYHAEPRDSDVPYFLAQELIPGYLAGFEGTYTPPDGYFVAEREPEAFAAYDATFPTMVPAILPGQLPIFCKSCGAPLTCDADCAPGFTHCRHCRPSTEGVSNWGK